MKLTTFAGFAALATAIFAAPQPYISQLQSRELHARTNLTAAEESQTMWSGVVIPVPLVDDNGNVDPYGEVTASFVVPTPQDENPGRVYAWVGIDGNNVNAKFDPVIQTGIDIETKVDGTTVTTTYRPWYEWEPSPLVYFPSESDDGRPFVINPGDELTFAIQIRSTLDSAEAIITNKNGDLTLTATFGPPNSDNNAIGKSAEFIMERVVTNPTPRTYDPLLNFGTVNFKDCVAVTFGDESVDLSGGPEGYENVPVTPLQMINKDDDTTVLASGSIIDELTAQIVWKNAGSTS